MSILNDVGWGVCHLVAKVVIGIAKMPEFMDFAYVVFQVTHNHHSHIFQSQPLICYWFC